MEFKGLVLDAVTTAVQVEEALRTECRNGNEPCNWFWQEKHKEKTVRCGGGPEGIMHVCNGETTIAGIPAKANVVIGDDGRLLRIALSFSQTSFPIVLEQVISKYAPPKTQDASVLQNAFGARFDQLVSTWNGPDGQLLQARRYDGSIEDSSVTFTTQADRDRTRRILGGDPDDL